MYEPKSELMISEFLVVHDQVLKLAVIIPECLDDRGVSQIFLKRPSS